MRTEIRLGESMTREEAIAIIENEKECVNRANKNDYCNRDCYNCELVKTDTEILTALDMAIKALEREPTDDATLKDIFCMGCEYKEQEHSEDAISRKSVIDVIERWLECSGYNEAERHIMRAVQSVLYDSPPVTSQPKTGHCKDCKWWKDSDGAYRRGIDAESKCPMNRIEVYEGNGYCFMFEPQESEDKE